jgi:hypothetical protein
VNSVKDLDQRGVVNHQEGVGKKDTLPPLPNPAAAAAAAAVAAITAFATAVVATGQRLNRVAPEIEGVEPGAGAENGERVQIAHTVVAQIQNLLPRGERWRKEM